MATFSSKTATVKIGASGSEAEPAIDVVGVSFDDIQEMDAYASNKTGGRKTRVAGLGDFTGTISVKEDGAAPAATLFVPGTITSLEITVGTGVVYSGSVMWGTHKQAVDINSGNTVGVEIPFEAAVASGAPTFVRPT